MRVADAFYTYAIPEKKWNCIRKKIEKCKKIKSLFVVCFPLTPDGILEIYPYKTLLQPYYQKNHKDITIIGVAKNMDGAKRIVLEIVQDMYDATDGTCFDARTFFAD